MSDPERPKSLPEQDRDPHVIGFNGLDKALVLAALYNGARPQGAGFFRYDPTPMSVEAAAATLAEGTSFDYLKGRVMKISLDGEEFDSTYYDRDNGEGSARAIIDTLLEAEKADPNNPTIRNHHLSEAASQAQIVRELLYEEPTVDGISGGIRVTHLGFADIAEDLGPKVREAQRRIRDLQSQ